MGHALDHEAERLRQERAEIAEHQRLRGELEAAGVTVTGTLPADGQLLTSLCHDGEVLTPETHAACPGPGRVLPPLRPGQPGVLLRRPGRLRAHLPLRGRSRRAQR